MLAPGIAAAAPVRLPGRTGTAERDDERWRTCQRLARELLLVGPDGEDLKLQYLKILIDNGLPKTSRPKDVLVVGAGIAGLVSALLLKRAGHRVTVVEANGNRIGGRIKTFRRGPGNSTTPFTDPAQYAEAGAMRLPDFHPMTLALIDRLGLRRRLFYNVDVKPGTGSTGSVPPVVYRSFTGEEWRNGPDRPDFRAPEQALRTWIDTNGQQVRRAEYARDPEPINRGFGIPGDQALASAGALLDAALDPVRDYYSTSTPDGRVNKPMAEWLEGWARVIYDFDHHSMGSFLTGHLGLDERTVDAIGTLENLTSRSPLSFIHSFLTRSLVDSRATYWEIEGGTARLPYALVDELGDDLRMNRRMTRLDYWTPERDGESPHVRRDGPRVWVETVSESGGTDAVSGTPGETEIFTADVAVVTVPFTALRHVEVTPLFSYGKRRAVIELHYDSATKVLLEFTKRWWEFDEDDWRRELEAIKPGLYQHYLALDKKPAAETVGGGSVTDNPNRFMYFPSHPVPGSDGGVVLASYSWAADASRWDSLYDDERYAYALRGMQSVYGKRIEAFYTGRGHTQSWLRNRYALGEAAVFTPRQFTELHPSITTAEGPVHFAGEHTSLKHSWIEGALESAVRVALEVNTAD
ncbi:flavin monoamine oxidase family protein [Actinophytocola gossypii]|uniref:FAD-dependent oxidoreductase n=1 Tax=Actinophytocola gossypii TaxID=2812003 RepID=A0ABT2JGN9_9PSEU|nr:NAD(P)/FAD-dependent oxidoreductase [Actinophytocola gossypii]MCT2586908.1 FAD-dependent oxidoreductase [Actinophytocola gossypii]